MQQPEIPENEEQRLLALLDAGLLDTAPEPRFDRLTELVQQCLGTEIVLISLIDRERQWFKSRQGLDVCETGRDISFCGHAILDADIYEVSDTTKDSRFADNPLVTGPPSIRFYAGAPLTIKRQRIGTLCIIDSKPRQLTQRERQILRNFADAIEQEVSDRLQEHAHQQLVASELMYRSVLEGTRIGTWQWNVQTGETVFNERWAQIVGFTLAELAPVSIDTWMALAHPDDMGQSEQLLNQHFSGETAFYDCKCRMLHKEGHWVWVHDRGRVVSWTDDGKPLMMFGTHADITEQKQAEIALKTSRDQFQSLVTNIPGITYRCKIDTDWTMLYMSGSIDPLSGYPASDFIKNKVRSYASVIHPEDRDWIESAVRQAIEKGQSWQFQYRVMHKNGSIRWVEERGRAENNDSDQAMFLDGFILDITQEKTLKTQLVKLTSQLPGVVYQYQQWPDGRSALPYASNAIEKLYGITAEQVKDDATAMFGKIYSEDLAALADSIDASASNLSVWHHQYRVYRPDGQLAWLSGRATPEAMPDGSTLWHGYIEDITSSKQYYLELERVNKALKLTQQRLDTASENALIGFWQASLKTGELWWSPVIYQIFGFDEAIIPSVALFKNTLHPEDRQRVADSEQQALKTGLHDVVHRIIRPDGTIRWVHELARMLPAAENPELVMVGSVQDVTERMQLQQMKDQFVSTVSHELRTPLTAINGALGILQSGILSQFEPKVNKLLDVAFNNSKRLQYLINDLLDIEKLTAGKIELHIEPVLLQPQLELAVANLQPYAEEFQVSLQLEPAADQLQLLADSQRLQQILTNLLSNAIKFSGAGKVVAISAEVTADSVKVAVHDHGPGIPAEFQSRIFERFAQADSSNRGHKGGTGLGLAICKGLLNQMNGQIGFSTKQGVGTIFYFELPRVSASIKQN